MFDEAFDDRLFHKTGIAFIPRPDGLTPDTLARVLDELEDPEQYRDVLDVGHWQKAFEACLGDGA